VLTRRLDAVLLDRDGTINVKAPAGQYITCAEQVELLPGAAEAVRALNRAGVPALVVTNQRGIALGHMTEDDLTAVHARLRELLAAEDAELDGIFHCPHDEGVCACRKPGTLLLEQARDHVGLSSLDRSVMIGDSLRDVVAGHGVGARAILLGELAGEVFANYEPASTLLEAVANVLHSHGLPGPRPGQVATSAR
jgi:D-glycero-D-manno-heptose 1,7-bisphosphate phosphatase